MNINDLVLRIEWDLRAGGTADSIFQDMLDDGVLEHQAETALQQYYRKKEKQKHEHEQEDI